MPGKAGNADKFLSIALCVFLVIVFGYYALIGIVAGVAIMAIVYRVAGRREITPPSDKDNGNVS
jgi:hypothetical protein